jgi:hypothetical protein
MAYAVFEDLALGDFGNRIPNLTFEIDADGADDIDVGTAIASIAVMDGRPIAGVAGIFPRLTGHFAGAAGGLSDTLSNLIGLVDGSIAGVDSLEFVGGTPDFFTIPDDDCQARLPNDTKTRERLNSTITIAHSIFNRGCKGRAVLSAAQSTGSQCHAPCRRIRQNRLRTRCSFSLRPAGCRPMFTCHGVTLG